MTTEMMMAKMELKELVGVFSNLADVKDAAAQGELFLPDGVLEFQMSDKPNRRRAQKALPYSLTE